MQFNLNLDAFIKDHVTFRQESLLKPDFEKYQTELQLRITNKAVLVIGGAGTIEIGRASCRERVCQYV